MLLDDGIGEGSIEQGPAHPVEPGDPERGGWRHPIAVVERGPNVSFSEARCRGELRERDVPVAGCLGKLLAEVVCACC